MRGRRRLHGALRRDAARVILERTLRWNTEHFAEGYRKAARIFELAHRFGLPLLTFIDTQGAEPGVGAEERGQAEAIAVNLETMARMTTPVLIAHAL